MQTVKNENPNSRKIIQIGRTAILWLITVILGLIAVFALIEGVDHQVLNYIFNRMQNDDIGIRTANSMSSWINLATILCSGVMWIGVVVFFGFTFHFRRMGERSSHRVFALTIGIEIVLIVIGYLLQII